MNTPVSPTVTVGTPAISVVMPNMDYQQFLNSLGDYAYFVNKIYILADTYRQCTEVAQFELLDKNGNQRFISLTPTVDPYQSQPAVYYDTKDAKMVFNGSSQLTMNVISMQRLQLSFYCTRISKKSALDAMNMDNFEELEVLEDKPKFFDEYEEVL